MSKRRNTILGWLVWAIGTRIAKRKAQQNKVKLGAAGVVAVALGGGIIAARANNS